MRIDASFIRSILPTATLQGTVPQTFSCTIDSRTLASGDIFIALRGSTHDGHDFLAQALERKCGGLVIAADRKDILASLNKQALKDTFILIVPDPLHALITLAQAWRDTFNKPLIAITGSMGKTSTKNILGFLLHEHGKKFFVSHGNQNTAIGVSLNILRLNDSYDGAIFEVGINQRGEMARIVSILKPSCALITYIGHSHLEGLGALADVSSEKRDIFKLFKDDNIGFINGDSPVLTRISYSHPVIKFGFKTTNQVQARKVCATSNSTTFVLKLYQEKYRIELPNNHTGAVLNSVAAAAIAYHLGVPGSVIAQALHKPIIVAGRFEKRKLKNSSGTIIHDCYNANPESMKAALLAFQKLETKAHKVAILGDMRELGVDSPFWHRQLGRFLRKVPSLQHVIFVGDMVQWSLKTVPAGLSVDHVATWQEALEKVQSHLASESVVLVKGSHGVGLYHLVEHLAQPTTTTHVS